MIDLTGLRAAEADERRVRAEAASTVRVALWGAYLQAGNERALAAVLGVAQQSLHKRLAKVTKEEKGAAEAALVHETGGRQ